MGIWASRTHGRKPEVSRPTADPSINRSPSKYFQARAKLIAKLSRHRTVMDYRQSVVSESAAG